MRMNDLNEPGDGLLDCLPVTRDEMRTQPKATIGDFSEVMAPQVPERLGEVVDDKTIMVCEQVIPHFRNLPAGEIEMQAVYESHIVAYYARHRLEEIAALHHHVDRLIGISEQPHARLAPRRFL